MNEAQRLMRMAEAVALVPRKDAMERAALKIVREKGLDDALAPIYAHKLIHTYAGAMELEYPELAAANGDVLPIDTSVPATATEWEYFLIDHHGHADWIDENGHYAPSSAITSKRFVGEAHELGHAWELNWFDLERATAANLPLDTTKRNASREYHDRHTNYVWLFGESKKNLPGLANHPNITVVPAPLNAGETSRLYVNKTNSEIVADFALVIESIPDATARRYFAKDVWVSDGLVKHCRRQLMGLDGGFKSLWDYIKDLYAGDETGQGKVNFKILNECDPKYRIHPKLEIDTSGIAGEFILAIPGAPKEDLCFMRMRPFTQRPPRQVDDFNVRNANHSKIGGCKCRIPTAVVCLRYGTV